MTRNTNVYLLAVGLLVLVGFAIALSRIPYATPEPPPVADNNDPEVSSITVALQHQYVAGANMFSGTLTTPTPCYQIVADAKIAAEDKERITLLLTTEASAEDVCVQVLDEKGFTVAIPSSPGAELAAVVLNGQRVGFNITEN